MARHSSLRASDADREAVTERLRRAAGEGRLDPDELEDRLHMALRARTYGELDRVVSDLPSTRVALDRIVVGLPSARTALDVATRVSVALVVLTLILVDAALTVAWWLVWVLMRAHEYAADRLGAQPRRPARLL
jgi:Domain of unknown function (DUF1707)